MVDQGERYPPTGGSPSQVAFPTPRGWGKQPALQSGRLQLLEDGGSELLGHDWRFHVSDGYTPGQLLPEIGMPGGPIVFAGDLVPDTQWLRLELTTAFDRNPESLVDEKERLLDHLVASGGRLFLARDPEVAMIKVLRDRQSRYQAFDQHRALRRLDS